MRKIYTLITLLLLCVGATTSAYGQFVYATIDSEPTAADNIETGVYVIKLYAKARTGYVYDNGGTGGVYVSSASSYVNGTDVLSLSMLWRVTKITTDGETYYYVRSAKGNYLPIVTSNGPVNLSSTYGSYTMEAASDQSYLTNGAYMKARGTSYYVVCNGSNTDNTGDMTLSYWQNQHNVDGTISNPSTLWSFYKADVSDLAMESIINNYSALSGIEFYKYCGYVGALDVTDAWSTFLKDGNYDNFSTALSEAYTPVEIVEGKYYQIKSVHTSHVTEPFFSSESIIADTEGNMSEADMIRTNADGLFIPQLWRFERTGSYYYVINANTGTALGKYVADNTNIKMLGSTDVKESNAGIYDVIAEAGTIYGRATRNFEREIIEKSNSGTHRLNANGTGVSDWGSDNNANDAGSRWYIIPVTEIPFTVNTTTHWASAMFPFEVTLPSELTAYTGLKENNATLTLQSIDSKVIPAKTAVFITSSGTGSSYKLKITSTGASAISGNVLGGTTLTRSGYSQGDLWMLTRNGSDPILKKNSSNITSVSPNKAFYPVQASSDETQESLQIGFGDATGIQNAVDTQSTKNVEYFDLNGRRVLYPTTGIYVTSTGQKVFIK